MRFWSAHTHSRSPRDAFASPSALVARAVELGQPAQGLTDHGTMAWVFQHYKACRAAGIESLPGIETYLSPRGDVAADRRNKKSPKYMHATLLSTSETGYRNLVALNNTAARNYYHRPALDWVELAKAADRGELDGVAITTGCWFGWLNTVGDPRGIISALQDWFDGRVYFELHAHGTDVLEGPHFETVYKLAQQFSAPCILANDVHYVNADEQPVHDTLKRLSSWGDNPDDAVFPGGGYHLVDEQWFVDRLPKQMVDAGLEGLDELRKQAYVRIPEWETFTLHVPDVVPGNPDRVMVDRCFAMLDELIEKGAIKKTKAKHYHDRLDTELDVILDAGFSGYMLLTALVCDYMNDQGIVYNVRGSASGSIVCWLLGITVLDPIMWGLSFDRFLSRDRTKPPDIDIDVEHDRRQLVIDWLSERYHVTHIGTWLEMGLSDDEEFQKGSLVIKYKQMVRKSGLDADAPIPKDTWRELEVLADKRAVSGNGVHAAGLLVAKDKSSMDLVPLQYVASSKTMTTAFDKNDIEAQGFVKLDFLGLKTLSAMRIAADLTGIDPSTIPLNDRAVFVAAGRGNTKGWFQLEGWTSRAGVSRLKPTKISDIVASMALFRPAAMESGATDDYINRRLGVTRVPTQHPIIAEETKSTYGVLLYQEQAIAIMKRLGLEVADIEKARKAIKASQKDDIDSARKALSEVRKRVAELAREQEMTPADIAWLDRAIDAYAAYGFNKAHAVAYGVLAYQTGWYATHYPVEFWTGMLKTYTGTDKEPEYLTTAMEQGVTFYPPHVNHSDVDYTADTEAKAIYKGLLSIKGIGPKTAPEIVAHAPYESLDDFARKVSGKRVTGAKALGTPDKDTGRYHSPMACGGHVAALAEAGALKGLEREA